MAMSDRDAWWKKGLSESDRNVIEWALEVAARAAREDARTVSAGAATDGEKRVAAQFEKQAGDAEALLARITQ